MARSSVFHSIATRFNRGAKALSSSSRLTVKVAATSEMPVTTPPGCAQLSTRPVATGSPSTAELGARPLAAFGRGGRGLKFLDVSRAVGIRGVVDLLARGRTGSGTTELRWGLRLTGGPLLLHGRQRRSGEQRQNDLGEPDEQRDEAEE